MRSGRPRWIIRRCATTPGWCGGVAALPEAEQEFWLRKAEELGWPVKRLRREVRASLSQRCAGEDASRPGARQGDLPDPAQSPTVRLQIQLTPEQLHACRAAADAAHLTTPDWAVLALSEAVRQALDSRLPHTRDLVSR